MVAQLQTTTLPAMPLHMATAGQTVELVSVRSCKTVNRRLSDLGLTAGMPIRVLKRDRSGLIIAVKGGSRLALGRGMAKKIMVRPVR